MYIINVGIYDSDSNSTLYHPIRYVPDESSASDLVYRLINDLDRFKDLYTKIDILYRSYKPVSFKPKIEDCPKPPKWNPGLKESDITDVMRNEREGYLKYADLCFYEKLTYVDIPTHMDRFFNSCLDFYCESDSDKLMIRKLWECIDDIVEFTYTFIKPFVETVNPLTIIFDEP